MKLFFVWIVFLCLIILQGMTLFFLRGIGLAGFDKAFRVD